MRSTPVARRGNQPGSHEFRVRFTRPLRGVRIVAALEPPTAVPAPPPAPVVVSPPPAPPATPAPPPSGFVQPDVSKELREDRERIEVVLGAMKAAVDRVRTDRNDRLVEWQQAAVELALTIATRLLHERIESDSFAIDAKVSDMIAQLGDDAAVTVRLNPADLALLNARLGGRPLVPYRGDPRFVADPNLGRGDCQVEGRESMLLSDVVRELDEIRDELLRSLKNARS